MNLFDPQNNLEFRDFARIFVRRKWYFLAPVVIIFGLGIFKLTTLVPLYESSCTIKINQSVLQLLPNSIKKTLPRVSEPATAYAVKNQILSSEYLREVIEEINFLNYPRVVAHTARMKLSYPEKDVKEIGEMVALSKLKKDIKVLSSSPNAVMLKAIATEPGTAYDIVKSLSRIFVEDSYRRAMSRVEGAMSFNDGQISIFKKQLDEAENELESFRRNRITNSITDDNLSKGDVTRIHNANISLEITINEKKDYLNYLGSQLSDYPDIASLPANQSISKIMSLIHGRIGEMTELMKRFSWKSPEIINVNRKINDLREEIRIEKDVIVRREYTQADEPTLSLLVEKAISHVDLEILQKKKVAIDSLIFSFKQASSLKPVEEMSLAKLEANVKVNRRIYNTFVQQNTGVEIEEMISRKDASDRFKIIDMPRKSDKPFNAGSNMIMLITVTAALGLGFGAIYLRELLDTSIRTVNEAEDSFKIPVLGVLPDLTLKVPEVEEKSRKTIPILIALLIVCAAGFLIVYFILPKFDL